MNTYDEAAFDRFCSRLIDEGFSPVLGTQQREWTGPLRPSLRPLTDATRMKITFCDGWPFRYAHVTVEGLEAEHAARGVICLWAADDPAQMAGRDLDVLWKRVDEWAAAAQYGFSEADHALDAYVAFQGRPTYDAELPLGDLVRRGTNGYLVPLTAVKRGRNTLMIISGEASEAVDSGKSWLRGAFYLRHKIARPPRDLDELRAALTHRQRSDLERGLTARAPIGLAEPSGGHDFIVLAWPRHGGEHDVVVVGFENCGDSLRATAMAATPNDTAARRRRAGPDADLLEDKIVAVAGVGSVGGHVAVALACGGVGTIRLHDDDQLRSVNVVRHVCPESAVGLSKTEAVAGVINGHAPWTTVEPCAALSHDPDKLATQVGDVHLVVDCTGVFSLSAALAEICRRRSVPLITGTLYHQGAVARVQRQAIGDTPIAARRRDPTYIDLPPEDPFAVRKGFPELGCTAPVNNAPPVAVLATAAEISHAAVDFLTGRRQQPDERVVVYRPSRAPFDRTGTLDVPRPGTG